jgi:hypothetical protein
MKSRLAGQWPTPHFHPARGRTAYTGGTVEIDNESLILRSRRPAEKSDTSCCRDAAPASAQDFSAQASRAAFLFEVPKSNSPLVARELQIGGAKRLNAFFANSVNSLSMSMVNFSCCVSCTPDVTREVTAQPTRSAVRMEAGIHAGV